MVIDDALPGSFCQDIIRKFEADDRKQPGVTFKGLNKALKDSDDLVITRLKEWNEVCNAVDNVIKGCIKEYMHFVNSKFPEHDNFDDVSLSTGYQIQKSGHYVWHNDAAVEDNKTRVFTFIFYLNTVTEGGETDFHYKSVKPVEGRVVMFPATWDYIHCGRPARNKYILTGWLYRPIRLKKILS
jgi:hypothetical protein